MKRARSATGHGLQLSTVALVSAILLPLFSSAGLLGCFDYSLRDDADPSGPDGSTDVDSASGDDTDSNTAPCPRGLTFESEIEFTELIISSKPAEAFTDSCPPGQVIVGFEGFLRELDLVHGGFRAVCGRPSISADAGECVVQMDRGDPMPLRGTSGDIEWRRLCPDNDMMIGFKARIGTNIDQTIFRCAPLLITRDGSAFQATRGAYTDLEPVAKDGGNDTFRQECPGSQVATTTYLQADGFLRAIGLGCQEAALSF